MNFCGLILARKCQFVRDYNTKEWVKLSDASYVYDKTIRTPMALNVISFKEKKDAEAFIPNDAAARLILIDLDPLNSLMTMRDGMRHMIALTSQFNY
jgi:hypothetical protein